MIFLLIIIGVCITYFLFPLIKKAFKGKKYWDKCEKDYDNLLKQGYVNRSALIQISKQSHPELSVFVHEKIVEKFNKLDRLVIFIFNALEFQPANTTNYGRKLNNQLALSILKNTTIKKRGVVYTNSSAVKKEIQSIT